MEVSHVNNLDTHAIIGGGDVQTFSTKQDAEFFEILSSTLYSNKKLAVVREVLCNSWDANIEAGRENKPVIVEITDNKMTFKDVGPGIPKEMMGDIYCTYGGSTKRHDGKKTGGFGLGSKAPFAYAKNFTVTTVNGGFKSVFNISRGTSASDGVPDLRCMVSVPSTEPTGITVSIPIQSTDRREFEELVKGVALMGGMLVRLNDKMVKRVVYPTDMPFTLVPTSMFPEHLNAKGNSRGYRFEQVISYYVKYGAVVYPIPEDFTKNRLIAVEKGTRLVQTQSLAVIFIAPPDSIGITPSRETLSMTDKSVETLKGLFSAANTLVKSCMDDVGARLVPQYKKFLAEKTDFDSANFKILADLAKKPVLGYELICKNSARNVNTHMAPTVINTVELLKEHLVYEYLSNNWGHAEVAKHLFAEDTDGTKILKMIRDSMIKVMPLFGGELFDHAITGGKVETKKKELENKFLNRLTRTMDALVAQGAEVFVSVTGYDNDKYYPDKIRTMIAEDIASQNHWNYRQMDTLVEYLLYGTKIKNFLEVPIYVTQSIVAVERVERAKNKTTSYGRNNAYITVVIRKKKDFEKMVETLKLWRFIGVTNITELDLLNKPAPVEHQDYILYCEGNAAKARKRLPDEEVKYYCYFPSHYMIPGIEGVKLNQKKINLDSDALRVLTYLFPDTILVPGTAEAAKAEERGLRNVFKVMSDEVIEYFNDPSNHQLLLKNLQDVRGYFRSYRLGAALRFTTPAMLQEALGKNPVYLHDHREIPTMLTLFFHLLEKQYSPKFGFQFIHRAADKTMDIFNAFFGNEVISILEDPLMGHFLDHLPRNHEKVGEELSAVYRAAILSAMQTVIVHRKLKKGMIL